MTNVHLTISCDCPYCSNGRLPALEWSEYWKEFPKGHPDDPADMEAWFEERGYMTASRPHFGKTVRLFPDEEYQCPDCEGTARLTKVISLNDLREMLQEVPQ